MPARFLCRDTKSADDERHAQRGRSCLCARQRRDGDRRTTFLNQVDVRCKAYRDCIVLCICKNARVSDLLFLERIVEESQSAYRHDSGFVGGRKAGLFGRHLLPYRDTARTERSSSLPQPSRSSSDNLPPQCFPMVPYLGFPKYSFGCRFPCSTSQDSYLPRH